jgi:hypothetical protein
MNESGFLHGKPIYENIKRFFILINVVYTLLIDNTTKIDRELILEAAGAFILIGCNLHFKKPVE